MRNQQLADLINKQDGGITRVAADAGLTVPTVYNIINGSVPSLTTARHLAQALNMTLGDLDRILPGAKGVGE